MERFFDDEDEQTTLEEKRKQYTSSVQEAQDFFTDAETKISEAEAERIKREQESRIARNLAQTIDPERIWERADHATATSATPETNLQDLITRYGAANPIPDTTFGQGFVHGFTFGAVGEEPRGVSGQVGNLGGIFGNIIAQTALYKRLFNVGGVGASMSALKKEMFAGLAADYVYADLDQYDDGALSYGVMAAANILVPWGLSKFGKLATELDEFGGIVKGAAVKGEPADVIGDEVSHIVNATKTKVIEEATPRNVKDLEAELHFPEGYSYNKAAAFHPQTQTEVFIDDIVQKTDNYRARYDTITSEYKKEVFNLTATPAVKTQGNKYIRDYVRNFLKEQKTLSDEEQIAILNSFDGLENKKALYKVVNDAFEKDVFTSAPSKMSVKRMQQMSRYLASRLDEMEDNISVGLKPTASKAERTARGKELEKMSRAYMKRLKTDEVLSRSREGIKKSLESLVANPAANSLTQKFMKSDVFNTRFPQAMAYMHQVEDPVLRAETLDNIYTNFLKDSDRLDRRVQASIRAALTKPQGLDETERVVQMIQHGDPIRPEEFDNVRPLLARFITKRMRDHLTVPSNQGTIRQDLALLNEQMKTYGKDPEAIKSVLAQKEQIKNQYIQQMMADPNKVKSLVDMTGDHELAQAVDIHYATLGDPNSTARLLMRRNQNLIRTQSDAVLQDLHNQPLKGGDEHFITTGSNSEKPFVQEKDLNIFRRMFGSLDVAADLAIKSAKSDLGRAVFVNVKQFLGHAIEARNAFLEELAKWNLSKLQPFYDYVNALGNEGSRALYHAIDTVAIKADDILKSGGTVAEAERWITDYVSGLSPASKKGYEMFRDMTDSLYDNVNAAIREHNSLVKQGLRRGEEIQEIAYRPGYVPYFYEGSYMLKWVNKNGSIMHQVVHDRTEAVDFLNKMHQGGQLNGRVVLEPLFMEDVQDAIQFTKPGQNIDDLFGIDGSDLNDLFTKKKLNKDNLHQVFWGNKLQRRLSLHDQRLDTDTALNIASRFSFRFKHYAPLAQEGNILVKELDGLGVKNWRDAMKVYGNDLLGRSRDTEKIFEDKIRSVISLVTDIVPASAKLLEQMGFSPRGRVVRGLSNGLTLLGRMFALGFNPTAALVQWFILPTNVGIVTGFDNMVHGMVQMAKTRNTEGFKTLMQKAGLHINPANIGMAERLELPKALTNSAQRVINFTDWASMYMFNGSENTIRASTLLAARRQAKQLGGSLAKKARDKWTWQEELLHETATEMGKRVDDGNVLDAYAIKIMRRTNFDFDITGLSEVARNPLLKPFAQFKTYFFKEYELLFAGGLPLTNKEKFMSLAMFTTIGGLFALPFTDELEQMSTAVFGFSPKLWVMDNMPEVFSTGVGGVIGIDLSGKANVGSLTRALTSNFFGVAPSKIGNQMNQYMQGNTGALDALTGTFGFMRGISQAKEVLQTGRVTDRYGQTLTTYDQLGPGGTAAMALGLPPKSLSRAMTLSNIGHILDEKQTARDRVALREYFEAKNEGDNARAAKIKKEAELSDRQIKSYADKEARSPHASLEHGMSNKVRQSPQGQAILRQIGGE